MRNMVRILLAVLLTAGTAYAQGKRFREFANTSPRAGEKAPDFKSVNEEGEEISLSQFKDKKHVILITGSIT